MGDLRVGDPEVVTVLPRHYVYGAGPCPKCGSWYWSPEYHEWVPCQQGCPEPWQWRRAAESVEPPPPGEVARSAVAVGFDRDRRGGVPHVRWVSVCGYALVDHPEDFVRPDTEF